MPLTEPSTGESGSLADHVAAGTAATLEAGKVLESHIVTAVLTRVDAAAPAETLPA